MSFRVEKINELVKRLVNEIILRELSLKEGVFITVSKVDTSADFRYTRVFASVFPEKETDYALKTLRKELPMIQKTLSGNLKTRISPRIEFRLDRTESKADEVEKLFRDLKKSE